MRTALIAAALCLLAQAAHAQSRPAPETPGEDDPAQAVARPLRTTSVEAIRVLVVTSGIIGGFVAADIISGGALTGPLLSGAALAAGASPPALGLRPIIAGAAATAPALPDVAPTVAQALRRYGAAAR